METLLAFLEANWLKWVFTAIAAIVGVGYRNMSKRLTEYIKQNEAISFGVQSLLRESIVNNYNKYKDRGWCPIYAKDSIKKVYSAYHELGGNDVATKLYEKMLEMPEEPAEKEI